MLLGWRQRLSTSDGSPSLEIDGAPVNHQVTFSKPLGVAFTKSIFGMFMSLICVLKKLAAGIDVLRSSRAFVAFDTTVDKVCLPLYFSHIPITFVIFVVAVAKRYLAIKPSSETPDSRGRGSFDTNSKLNIPLPRTNLKKKNGLKKKWSFSKRE